MCPAFHELPTSYGTRLSGVRTVRIGATADAKFLLFDLLWEEGVPSLRLYDLQCAHPPPPTSF